MDVGPDVGVDAAEAQHELEALQVGRFLLRSTDGEEEEEASLVRRVARTVDRGRWMLDGRGAGEGVW